MSAHDQLKLKVGSVHGLPAELCQRLAGRTERELHANAAAVSALRERETKPPRPETLAELLAQAYAKRDEPDPGPPSFDEVATEGFEAHKRQQAVDEQRILRRLRPEQ